MYKIIEPQKEFEFNGKKYKPIVTVQKIGEEKYWNIIVEDDNYIIFKNVDQSQSWKIEECIFDKYFIEVLRLLPENPKDLNTLNQDYFKKILELWQSEENFSLDKSLLEFEEINKKIEEYINEKKGV